MATTITTTIYGDPYTVTPIMVLGFEASAGSNNIFHTTLAGGQDVTLVDASLPTGTFTFLFDNQDDANLCYYMHFVASTLTLSDDVVWMANTTYVTNGSVKVTLDDDTRSLWKVSVDYQAVIPS